MTKGMEFWMAHVAAVKLEAISASAYARRHGISVTALYYWQQKLKSKAEVSEEQKSKFLALHIAAQSPCLCTLVLPSGLHLEMSAFPTPEWLAALGRALPGEAPGVTAAITQLLLPHKHKCHTVTFDNGKEFAEHEKIAAELQTDIYFAHPYRSWERGLNENSNGLVREYFPKDMELTDVTQEQVQWMVDRINHRPRKVLGFRTPFEVYFGKTVRYTKPPLAVALRT